ncbi:hypothetical protein D3C73_1007360 [compost metagenome]
MLHCSLQAAVAGEGVGLQLDDGLHAGPHEAHVAVQDQGLDDQILSVRDDGDQGLPRLGDLSQSRDRHLVDHARYRGREPLQGLTLISLGQGLGARGDHGLGFGLFPRGLGAEGLVRLDALALDHRGLGLGLGLAVALGRKLATEGDVALLLLQNAQARGQTTALQLLASGQLLAGQRQGLLIAGDVLGRGQGGGAGARPALVQGG